jgi:curved DNA-binding protein
MEYKDYYQILGVDKNASEKDIKRAYRKLAHQYHPDKNPNDNSAEERFKEINEAYEVVGDADNRSKYDQLGRSYHRYQQMGGASGGFDYSQWAATGGPRGSYQQVNIDFEDLFGSSGNFSEFFRTVFGGGVRTQSSGMDGLFGQGFGRQSGAASRDMDYELSITLEEAYHGTSRTLSARGERFTAKIPRGAKSGTKIRLRGKGQPGPTGPGDLYLVIQVQKHDTFKQDGHNLKVVVPVSVVDAVLGARVTVPTMTGDVKLTIPSATQGGQTFRLKGKGMPHLRNKEQFGDLLVTIRIRIPDSLNEEEEALYRQLASLNHPTSD